MLVTLISFFSPFSFPLLCSPRAPFLPAGVWNHTLIAHSLPSDRHHVFCFFVSHRCDVITNGPGRECRWIFMVSLSLWFNWQERPTWTSLYTPQWLIYSWLYITVPLLNGPLRERHDQIFKNSSHVPQCHIITIVIVLRLILIIYVNM